MRPAASLLPSSSCQTDEVVLLGEILERDLLAPPADDGIPKEHKAKKTKSHARLAAAGLLRKALAC